MSLQDGEANQAADFDLEAACDLEPESESVPLVSSASSVKGAKKSLTQKQK